MEPVYFVIAILGCADGGSSCTPVATLPTHFATREACSAATGPALIDNNNYDYPSLLARCRAGESKAAQAQEMPSGKRRRG